MKELERLLVVAAKNVKSKEIVLENENGSITFRYYGTVWLGMLRIDNKLSSVALLDSKGNVLNDDDDFADDCAEIGFDVVDVYDKVNQS